MGLGVVAFAGNGLYLSGAQNSGVQPGGTTQIVTTAQPGTEVSTNETSASTAVNVMNFGPAADSQVKNIDRQPVTLTLLALVPVLAASLFGLMLYTTSKKRDEAKERAKA